MVAMCRWPFTEDVPERALSLERMSLRGERNRKKIFLGEGIMKLADDVS